MNAMKHLFSLVLLLAVLPAQAQDTDQVAPEKRQRIERLLEVTGALNVAKIMSAAVTLEMTNAVKQVRPDIPPEALDIVAEEVNSVISQEMVAKGGFVDLIVPVYARHFTNDELDVLIAFYGTPVGQKTVKMMPQITKEAMQIGQRWGQTLGPTIVERVRMRLNNEGIEL